MEPLRIGIVGLGGFADAHHHAVARLEAGGQLRLLCTCDPAPAAFASQRQAWRFADRGVRVFADYREMLDACHRDLDALVVPTPIQLHAEMHAAATALGLPVYLEKPPTLDYAELEQMIANDTRARHASCVGFNFIIEKQRLALKRRLLEGEFGAIRSATLEALWPRPADYFSRNPWTGRLRLDGRTVLDSCFGNALSHFVHNLLFWNGTAELFDWAQIASVRAELYRAHPIESADTFFVETETTGGVTLRFALSHACAGTSTHCETLACERAVLRYSAGRHTEIAWHDGLTENAALAPFDSLTENHLHYARYLRGGHPRPATTLADTRPFVILTNLAHISSGHIAPIPAALVSEQRDDTEQKNYLHVANLAAASERFLVRGIWPGASGWERETGPKVTPADLPRFHEVVRTMAAG